jgi:hypothetical protein
VTRFIVTFRPASGSDGIRGLRWLLKRARRDYGLVAVDAREMTEDTVETSDASNTPDMREQFLAFVRSIAADR